MLVKINLSSHKSIFNLHVLALYPHSHSIHSRSAVLCFATRAACLHSRTGSQQCMLLRATLAS